MDNTSQRRQLIILGICVVLLVIGGAVWYALARKSSVPKPTQTVSPSAVVAALTNHPAPASAPTTGPQLHVGLYMSKMTGDQDGYSIQIVGELSRGDFDLVPILEPGTASVPEMKKLLDLWFKDKSPVDVFDPEALKKLDVIVAPRIWMLPDEALAAIEAAVKSGTGLLARNGLGCMRPGSGPEVSRLSGFTESAFAYNPHPMECEVIGSHPILGKLAGKIGQSLQITPNGTWGIPNAQTIPLIKVKDMKTFSDFAGGDQSMPFYPLYVSQLGKGRIVGCQFPAWSMMPKDLMSATDQEFNIRAVLWLAHKLDEKTPATTRATTSTTR
jgi:hypothetical protein